MAAYRLIITPDNSDPAVEDFTTMAAATRRAAQIIRWDEPDWPTADIEAQLRNGTALSYHDHSEIRLVQA